MSAVADGIPFLPPLAGSPQVPTTPRSLARLVTTLGTVAMTAESDEGQAIVVFLDRHPVLAAARHGSVVLTGEAAIARVLEAPAEQVRLFEVGRDLAWALGAYFLPTIIHGLPAASVAAEAFICSFARPAQQACVIVRTVDDLGLVFLDGARVALAYTRSRGEAGGLEQVAGLLADPSARLTVRTAPSPSPPAGEGRGRGAAPASADPATSSLPAGESPRTGGRAPAAAPPPAGAGALATFLDRTVSQPAPAARTPEPEDPELLAAVLAEIGALLGRSSARIEDVLRTVPPTPDALAAAVIDLRDRGVRLISRERMDLVVDRTLALLQRPGVSSRNGSS